MYIQPGTMARLIKGAPIDNSYTNTLYFQNETSRNSYFSSLPGVLVEIMSYQREQRTMKVGVPISSIYDINYLMFRNTGFENKWYYCFVTDVRYISNECTEITFEVDVINTWWNQLTLGSCFVEREHSATDNIGDNTQPEPVDCGEYILQEQTKSGVMGNNYIVVAAVDSEAEGKISGGIYSAVNYTASQLPGTINDYIQTLVAAQKEDAIVTIFMMPGNFVTESEGVTIKQVTKSKSITTVDGYIPKNKKLFTYPYNYLNVSNTIGSSMDCRYEDFSGNNCVFNIAGAMTCSPELVLIPIDYKGVLSNLNECLTLSGFPQCAYANDTFKVWLAQNAANIGTGYLTTAFSMGASVAGNNIAGVVSSGASLINQTWGVKNAMAMPATLHGSPAPSTFFAAGNMDFVFSRVQVKREYAQRIDEFFTAYGYASNRVKIPNINSRPRWNYVKTRGCNLKGNAPSDVIATIKSLFDRGITWWKNGSEVGNYSLDNTP